MMKSFKEFIIKELSCPLMMCGSIALLSFAAIAIALTSEVALGLEPCILCIYQRIPFAAGFIFGLIGLIFRKRAAVAKIAIALSGIGFLINSAIALYHSGVELKWWRSAVEGCVVPGFGTEPQSILENILSAPSARCDEIPWADPLLGLSMANYNVALCFGLAVLCAISLWLTRQHPSR